MQIHQQKRTCQATTITAEVSIVMSERWQVKLRYFAGSAYHELDEGADEVDGVGGADGV